MIKLPSYWYIDRTLLEDEQKMDAVCAECNYKHKLNGWYWPGDVYGDYDLNCSICKTILYQRDEA